MYYIFLFSYHSAIYKYGLSHPFLVFFFSLHISIMINDYIYVTYNYFFTNPLCSRRTQNMFDEYPITLTVAQCCEILGVGNHTIYRLIEEGRLSARRVGEKMWRIPRTALAKFVLKESGIEVSETEVDNYV